MSGVAIITEACINVKDRACVDVCPVQCIYEFDAVKNVLVSEVEAGSGIIENSHSSNPDSIAIFGDTVLYVNLDECTSCTACYQPQWPSRDRRVVHHARRAGLCRHLRWIDARQHLAMPALQSACVTPAGHQLWREQP